MIYISKDLISLIALVVINGSKIAEQGTHEELLKLRGAYYALYSMQFKKQEA